MTDHETTARDRARAQDVIWRVTAAVEILCIGKGDVRSRLESAVVYQLEPLRERDFPVALREKFRRIMDASKRYDASDLDKWIPLPLGSPLGESHTQFQGRIQATMRRIRRSTGAKIAQDIWTLYQELLEIAGLPK